MEHGKALITGASGFVGRRLRQFLTREGLEVVALRRPGSPPAKTGRAVQASYDDLPALTQLMREEKPDWVFHVAGVTKGVKYDDFWRGNVLPTQNLLKALEAGHPDVRRFVHVSSLTSYGPSTPGRPTREEDPRRPVEHYGRSKLEAEEIVEDERNLPWTIVRPAGVYGPGDVDYLELFKITRRGINLFFGNRRHHKSVIYIDDCVRAIALAAQSDRSQGQGYFLCDGSPLTWDDFQRHVVAAMDRRVLTLNLPGTFTQLAAVGGELATRIDGKARLLNRQKARMGAQKAWTCSGEKAAQDFGFEAAVFPAEGTRLTHEWYQHEGWY
ncbi:MAG: NAD-dependent epimerase/dehydratase family protein [Myxococcota bacterium]